MGAFFIMLMLCFTICVFSVKSDERCSSTLDIETVKFPNRNAFMTIEEFDKYIEGKPIRDIANLKKKGTYVPDSNFFCTFTKQDENTYKRTCTGITDKCNLYTAILTKTEENEEALFTVGTNVDAYWSPCPERYILRIQCAKMADDSIDCGVNNVKLSLLTALDQLEPPEHPIVNLEENIDVFLPGTMRPSDAPLNEIVKELDETTKVKFGAGPKLEWTLDLADGTPCEPNENK